MSGTRETGHAGYAAFASQQTGYVCEMEVASHRFYSPLNIGVPKFCWPGNNCEQKPFCQNLRLFSSCLHQFERFNSLMIQATPEGPKGDTEAYVRDGLFSGRYQITPPTSSGKSERGEQDKIYNVIAKLLAFESKTPILCEEYEGNRCSRVEFNG